MYATFRIIFLKLYLDEFDPNQMKQIKFSTGSALYVETQLCYTTQGKNK